MSIETLQAKYPVINKDRFENLNLRQIVSLRKESKPHEFVWSARLSTGIFGLPDCPSGNGSRVPKNENEVLLAIGDEGLEHLIDLGFLPCPTCHPEKTEGFWEKAKDAILFDYPEITDPVQILDRNLIPFDAVRIDWEKLAPYLTRMPNRIYTKPGLGADAIKNLNRELRIWAFPCPPSGSMTAPIKHTSPNI